MTTTFAEKFTAELEARKISPAAFAKRIGMKPRSVHEWCRGDSKPRSIGPVLDALGIAHTDREGWRDLARLTCGEKNWQDQGPLSELIHRWLDSPPPGGSRSTYQLAHSTGLDEGTITAALRGRPAVSSTLARLFGVLNPSPAQRQAIVEHSFAGPRAEARREERANRAEQPPLPMTPRPQLAQRKLDLVIAATLGNLCEALEVVGKLAGELKDALNEPYMERLPAAPSTPDAAAAA